MSSQQAVRVKTSEGWQDLAIVGPQGPPSGQMVLIEDKILSADTALLDFQNIPPTFAALKLIVYARSSNPGAFDTTYLRFNGDTSSIYDYVRVAATGGGFQPGAAANLGGIGIGHTQGAGGPANTWTMYEITIPNYANTFGHKNAIAHSMMKQGATVTDFFVQTFAGWWRSTAAINRVNLFMTNNFVVGSRATLYGIKAEPEGVRQNWNDIYCQIKGIGGTTVSVPSSTWTLVPVPAIGSAVGSLVISKADGTNDDFTRNADGSVTINKPGNYEILATYQSLSNWPDNANLNTTIAKKAGATPASGDGLVSGNMTVGTNTNSYPADTIALGQWCDAGDRIACYVWQNTGTARDMRLNGFSITRTGAGPQGVPGPPVTPGAAGQIYGTDSTGALAWKGGMQLIEEKILTVPAGNLDFQNIPQNFAHLILIGDIENNGGATGIKMRFNNDASAVYFYTEAYNAAGTWSFQLTGSQTGGRIGVSYNQGGSSVRAEIPNYSRATFLKQWLSSVMTFDGTNITRRDYGGQWRQALQSINRITLYCETGNNFAPGTRLSLYGLS
jgi:hypothetical protein